MQTHRRPTLNVQRERKRALLFCSIFSFDYELARFRTCGLPVVLRHDPAPRGLSTNLRQGMTHWSRDKSNFAPILPKMAENDDFL